MSSKYFGLHCKHHCDCAPKLCNITIGCSFHSPDHFANSNDRPVTEETVGDSPWTRNEIIWTILGFLLIYSILSTVIILKRRVLRMQRKRLEMQNEISFNVRTYVVPDMESTSSEIGTSAIVHHQDFMKNTPQERHGGNNPRDLRECV